MIIMWTPASGISEAANVEKDKITAAIIAAVLILAGLCYSYRSGIHSDGGTTDSTGASIQRAQDAAGKAEESIDRAENSNRDAQQSTQRITDTNRKLEETVDRDADAIRRGQQILETIRSQRKGN